MADLLRGELDSSDTSLPVGSTVVFLNAGIHDSAAALSLNLLPARLPPAGERCPQDVHLRRRHQPITR
jgi:hypothetical protein